MMLIAIIGRLSLPVYHYIGQSDQSDTEPGNLLVSQPAHQAIIC